MFVVTRPDHEFSVDNVGPAVAARVVDVRGLAKENALSLVEAGKQKIFVTDSVMMAVSATAVRQAAREDSAEDLNRLVKPAVANYIRKYRLHRNTNEA